MGERELLVMSRRWTLKVSRRVNPYSKVWHRYKGLKRRTKDVYWTKGKWIINLTWDNEFPIVTPIFQLHAVDFKPCQGKTFRLFTSLREAKQWADAH